MDIYMFQCKSCGAKEYQRKGDVFECPYCGYKEEILSRRREKETIQEPEFERPSGIPPKAQTHTVETNEAGLTPTAMFLICLIFGMFGVHKFIERKYALGIFYLMTYAFFGIGWLIDIINYASKAIQANNSNTTDNN